MSVKDKRERRESSTKGGGKDEITTGRMSSRVESWDFHDPYMARRWAMRSKKLRPMDFCAKFRLPD